MRTLDTPFRAIVVAATGGIGQAVHAALDGDPHCSEIVGLSRATGLDVTDERSIADAARSLADRTFDLIVVASGTLSSAPGQPEKTIRNLDPDAMLAQLAVNAVGPALLLKHLSPLLPRDRRALFGVLSARVGSIGDNRLGGWISYRASKAAVNQIVRTAAIEIARTRPQAVVAALHPGTVATRFSDDYAANRTRLAPAQSARAMLDVLDTLDAGQSGGFYAYDGSAIEW